MKALRSRMVRNKAVFPTLLIVCSVLVMSRGLLLLHRASGPREDMLLELRGSIALRQTSSGAGAEPVKAKAEPKTAEELSVAEPRVLPKNEIEELLQSISYKRKHQNCSVVGNDSSMRESKLGKLVDSAESVYRMNFAPVKDYVSDIGRSTHTQCLNPQKFRHNQATNAAMKTDTGTKPRVVVVGDTKGPDDRQGNDGPCMELSPGGSCVKRLSSDSGRVRGMDYAVQTLTEELLATVQSGVGEVDGVPTTGLYCLVLALMECAHVDVYGMGVGTINHKDLSDLEYFKDPMFQGWDARHNAEAERALLRILASRVWTTSLVSYFGELRWHNPLKVQVRNEDLLSRGPCTSGINCRR